MSASRYDVCRKLLDAERTDDRCVISCVWSAKLDAVFTGSTSTTSFDVCEHTIFWSAAPSTIKFFPNESSCSSSADGLVLRILTMRPQDLTLNGRERCGAPWDSPSLVEEPFSICIAYFKKLKKDDYWARDSERDRGLSSKPLGGPGE